MPVTNLMNKVFGLWRVTRDAGDREVGCRCECGKRATIFRYNLTRGLSTGCASCANRKTKPGKIVRRYGQWTVLGRSGVESDNRGLMIRVRCDCGREGVVRASDLRRGRSSSCKQCAARNR